MKIFDLDSEKLLLPLRKNVFALVALFIIVVAIYSNTFDASWHFDDGPNILNNRALHLTHLNWQDIKKTFFASWGGGEKLYRPVACFSFALNYYVGRSEVSGYHAVNLAIHFVSSVFLFLFIHNTLNLAMLKGRYGADLYSIALLASVLWAISPVQTQAVTYVVQRMASMAGMFYIMAMYFYFKGRTSTKTSLKKTHYLICVVCGIFAFNSKENSAMLPISILLFDLFFIQGITKRNIKRYFSFLLIAVLMCVTAVVLFKGFSELDPQNMFSGYKSRGFTLFERLLTEPRIVLFYISLLLYPMPHRLSFVHDISVSKGLFDPPTTILAVLIILTILGLAIVKSKRWPFISFCVLFFFINHSIESTVIPLELVFEHRNYIPSMLFFVPIVILIVKGIRFFSGKNAIQFIISAFVVLVIIALGHSTFVRNFVWKTDESLWLDAVEKSPNLPRSHHNLGKYYADIGLSGMALDHYREALRLPEGPNRKSHYLTYHNMATLFRSMKDNDRAQRCFLEAVGLEPRFPLAYVGLGILNTEKGQNDKALEYFIKALTHDISSKQARNYTGLILLKKRQIGLTSR